MNLEMIVAMGKYDRAIGQGGAMPWGNTLKRDLQRFRQLTLGKSVLMGNTTFESIGHPLPGRQNIVISSRNDTPEGVTFARSLEEACAIVTSTPIVIGGGRLYEAALPYTDTLFATEVEGRFPDADTFFPEIPPEPIFIEAPGARQRIPPDILGGFAYEFTIYFRHLEREIIYESFV